MNKTLPLLLSAGLAACATASQPVAGPAPVALAACPSGPHCVSSLASDADHQVAPFTLREVSDWPKVVAALKGGERTTLIQGDERYAHAEVTSPWHFYTDDVELMRTGTRVDVRSSSRIGYYDFQVNRKRVEALRDGLAAQGLLRSASH